MSCKSMPILNGNVNLWMFKILQKKKVETHTKIKMIFLTNQITININFQLFFNFNFIIFSKIPHQVATSSNQIQRLIIMKCLELFWLQG